MLVGCELPTGLYICGQLSLTDFAFALAAADDRLAGRTGLPRPWIKDFYTGSGKFMASAGRDSDTMVRRNRRNEYVGVRIVLPNGEDHCR